MLRLKLWGDLLKTLRYVLGFILVVLAVVIGVWQFNRHMVRSYARASVAHALSIPQNKVIIERVQELGFWRNKLNPFAYQSWTVDFTAPGGPSQSSGASYFCNVDEPSFGHFKFQGIPVSLPNMSVKH